jgi:membrane protein DedA with SNARE-associated domain
VNALLDALRATVEGLILATGYVGIGTAMFVENVMPPVPAEFVLPFAGLLVAAGDLSFAGVLASATLGSTLGTCVFYVVARTVGDAGVRRLVTRWGTWIFVSEARYAAALAAFRRHGDAAVFWGRFVPGIRSVVSLPAGVSGMPFARFAALTVAGTALWNGVLLLAGVLLESQWARVVLLLERLELVAWLLVVVGVSVWLIRRRARARTADGRL